MQACGTSDLSGSPFLRALKDAGLLHHADSLCSLDSNQLLSLHMQDYGKYGIHTAEDKQKLFRILKSGAQGRPRISIDSDSEYLAVEGQNRKQQALRRQSGNLNGRASVAPVMASSLAEKVVESNEPAKIRVIVRKRPLNSKERENNEEDTIQMDMESGSVMVSEPKTKVDLTKYTDRHTFRFDACLDENVDNDQVYKSTVQPLVTTIFRKGMATCFAYGQTGSGKTYTMAPLPLRAAADIFTLLADPQYANLQLWTSCFEIYAGRLYDLLAKRNELVSREDAKKTVQIVGLREIESNTVRDIQEVLNSAGSHRSVSPTAINADSSRSHCILQFVLKTIPPSRKGKTEGDFMGKITFIDLAGSERGADTFENSKQVRTEGAEINKSLLALKECIRALDSGQSHVPFRGSKLTEVLRDSFTGSEARTVMIANVSPNSASCEHTLNTLRYADRVKELKKGRQGGGTPEVDICMKKIRAANPAVPNGRPRINGSISETGEPNHICLPPHMQLPTYLEKDELPADDMHHPEEWLVISNGSSQGVNQGASEGVDRGRAPRGRRQTTNGVQAHPSPMQPSQRERPGRDRETTPRVPLQPNRNLYQMEGNNPYLDSEYGIPDAETQFITEHRKHIEETMRLVRAEMSALSQVDQGGSAAVSYVENLGRILKEKAEMTTALQKRLTSFQKYVRQNYGAGNQAQLMR